jgi:outer membrane protein OmpA-like peptidoglycan-associated protein
MNRVGGVVGTPVLPFDEGAVAAGDTLIAHIKSLQSLGQETGDLNKTLGDRLSATLNRIESTDSGLDPMQVAERLDGAVQRLLEEKGRLSDNLTQAQSQFSQLRQDHDQVAAELEARNAMEEKLKKAKAVLNPSEGEVLFNASNDLVLRLSGLSFAVGKSDIQDEHIPLLEKVKSIIEMFPESKLTVEGHTDASGDLAGNMTLSEKRAYAVMQYLRQSLLISADRISAIGYGSDKPVAPNETAEGRAKNRRIDVIIMH